MVGKFWRQNESEQKFSEWDKERNLAYFEKFESFPKSKVTLELH